MLGIPGLESYKEEFTKVDNENYVKEATVIDGDLLKLGFLFYMIRIEVIAKGPGSSVVRTTVEYEIDDAHTELEAVARAAPFGVIAVKLSEHAKEKKVITQAAS